MSKRKKLRRNSVAENRLTKKSMAAESDQLNTPLPCSKAISDKYIGLLIFLTPVAGILVGVGILFLDIWQAIEAKDRSWRIFVSSIEADWHYVLTTARIYAITGFMVALIVEPLLWIYRRSLFK